MLSTLYPSGKRLPISQAEREALEANAPAVQYLVEAYHRDPPGPPTDNRLVQTYHYTDIVYLGICALAKALSGSTLRIMKRSSQPDIQSKKARRMARVIRKASGPMAQQEHHDDDLVEAPRQDRFVKLFDKINENDTLGDLLTGWVTQRNLTGTSFLWCRPSKLGYNAPPAELYILPTALMQPLYAFSGLGVANANAAYPYGAWRLQSYYAGGVYGGTVGPVSSVGAILDGREIYRHRKYHPLFRWDGYSPLTAGGVEFDVVQSIAQSWKAAMDHGFRPDGIATIKGASESVLTTTAAKFQQSYGGSRQQNRLVFTNGEGVSFDKFFTEPRQMDYDKAWEQMVKFGGAVLGVPPAILGLTEATSYAQLYASLKQFYTLTLAPEAREISQFLTKHVIAPFEEDTIVQISVPEIDDKEFDLKRQDTLAKNGVITGNELRAWAGKEPRPDCEMLLAGGPAGAAGMAGQPGMDPNADPNDGEAQLAALLGQPGGGDAGGQGPAAGQPQGPKNNASAGSLPGRIPKSRIMELLTAH